MENKKDFVTYDYTTIIVRKNLEPIYIDVYESFGWELIDNEVNSINSIMSSKLSFKRDRKINNKNALIKLQNTIDNNFSNIAKLESSKYLSASIKAYSIGVLACVFLALSVFMITGMLALGSLTFPLQIVLGAIGVILCIPPYFVYRNTVALKTEQIQPQINEEYDKISEKCEEANLLIQK